MQQLINITTNSQGEQVVSARELYDFLGFESANWKRWAIKNIEKNQFAFENTDWVLLIIKTSSNNGSMTNDYALSLDFSKRLSQMARTQKGEEIRNYFIACEKQLNKPKTQAELFLESAQMLVIQEQRIQKVESRLEDMEQSRIQATQFLLEAERSQDLFPETTLRSKIRKLINNYCFSKKVNQHDVWTKIYTDLYYRYGVNLNVTKKQNESKFDAAERLGHLDKIFTISSNILV